MITINFNNTAQPSAPNSSLGIHLERQQRSHKSRYMSMARTSAKHFQFLLPFLLFTQPALAHPGHHDIIGFGSGFSHPWLGHDHILVMIGIGLWSFSVQYRFSYQSPLAFFIFMVMGALISYQGISLEWAAQGVTVSLIPLGAALLLERYISIRFVTPLTCLIGLCHGYAHGLEIESSHTELLYLSGLVCSTVLMYALGLCLACLFSIRQAHFNKSTGLFYMIVGILNLV